MKSLFYLSVIASLLFVSCSGDDDSVSDQQNSESKKLVNTINLNGILLLYTYNEDQTVKMLEFGVTDNMLFTYSENRISSIEKNDDVWEFLYDENGKIKSFSNGMEIVDVVYNATENSYSYEKEEGIETVLVLTENGDVKKYIRTDIQTDETSTIEYFYDNSKNGIFTNSNAIAIYLVMMTSFYDIGLYTSKKPVQTFSNNGVAISFENTYDEENYLIKSILPNGIINYTYTQ